MQEFPSVSAFTRARNPPAAPGFARSLAEVAGRPSAAAAPGRSAASPGRKGTRWRVGARGQPLFPSALAAGSPSSLCPRRARRLRCPRPPVPGTGEAGTQTLSLPAAATKGCRGEPLRVPECPAAVRLLPGAPPTGSSSLGCGYLVLRGGARALLTPPLLCQGKQSESEGRRSHPSLRTKLQLLPAAKFAAGQRRSRLPFPATDLCNRTLCTESRSSRFLVTGRGMLYLPAPNIASARGPFIARPTACPAAPGTAGGRGQVGALQPARLRRASRAVLEPAGATPRGTGEARPTQLRTAA